MCASTFHFLSPPLLLSSVSRDELEENKGIISERGFHAVFTGNDYDGRCCCLTSSRSKFRRHNTCQVLYSPDFQQSSHHHDTCVGLMERIEGRERGEGDEDRLHGLLTAGGDSPFCNESA